MGHVYACWTLRNFSHLEINLETATLISCYLLTVHMVINFYHSSHYKPSFPKIRRH